MLIYVFYNSCKNPEREIINSLHTYLENPFPINIISNIKQKRHRNLKKVKIDLEKNLYISLRQLFPKEKIETIIESIILTKSDELWYGSRLFKDKNLWIREKITPVGRIDGLNLKEKRIVELKFISGWKSALGQILAYSFFYPTFQKEIWLLEDKKISEKEKNLIREICKNLSVFVEFINF